MVDKYLKFTISGNKKNKSFLTKKDFFQFLFLKKEEEKNRKGSFQKR